MSVSSTRPGGGGPPTLISKPTVKAPRPIDAPERPGAVLRVSPTGTSDRLPRDYMIVLELALASSQRDPETVARAQEIAAHALSGVSSGTTATEGPTVRELRSLERRPKEERPVSVITGVEASVMCADWPSEAVMEGIRGELKAHGYHVTTIERRVCAEPACGVDAVIAANRRTEAPAGWHSERICGRHDYRSCGSCQSLFKLIASAAAGQAPSVNCPVCGVLLIEWGGSKLYHAELVRKGPAT